MKKLFTALALSWGVCFGGVALADEVGVGGAGEVTAAAVDAVSIAVPATDTATSTEEPAAAPEALDTGTTAWMMTASALVIMMCIPGLAMFYAGMVNAKNVLSVFSQFFATAGVVSILWIVFGYSIATDTTGMEEGVFNLHSFIGGTGALFLAHLTPDSVVGGMPESVLITS